MIVTKYRKKRCIIPKKIKYFAKCFLGKFKETSMSLPNTIQLPITYKCNFDCVMCGMRTLVQQKDISIEELKTILEDKLFSRIITVGLNGGEPFIIKNLCDYVKTIVSCLPKLKHIFLITNGYFTDSVLEKSKEIKKICSSKNIKFHLSVSIDGIGKLHDIMRGHINAFEKCINTVNRILENPTLYCDDFNTICTITKINVYNLAEIEAYAKKHSIPIAFNVATIHKRLNNEYKFEDFSIFTDEHARMIAAEFLYSKFLETNKEMYFARYYFVKYGKRISICGHKSKVVTLTPNGNISYCATFSNELGCALTNSAYDIFYSKENMCYRKKLHNEFCHGCSHYTESLNKNGYKLFFKELNKRFKIGV